jgi:signal peptidase I
MSRRRLLGGLATVAIWAVAGLVVALATGIISVVSTHGTSMLPRFGPGDLAVVWAAGGYRVGQVVAYESPLLHTVVLHRIVAHEGALFSFKGDNNSFLDPLRLPASAIKGSLLLHIPRAGAWLTWLKEPVHLLVVLAALLLAAAAMGAPTARRGTVPAERGPRPAITTKERPGPTSSAVALPLALALAFAFVTGVGLSRPQVRYGSEPVPYSQRVSFSYTALVARSVVYPDGVVRTGQPVFLNLVSSIDIRAHFSFSTRASHTPLTGTIAGTVTLVYGTGWSSLLERLPPVALRASQATTTASLDLARVAQVLAEADKATGIEAAMPTIVVTPTVSFRGSVSGQPISAMFAPSLSFDLNSFELSLAGQAGANGLISSSQLRQSQTGSVYRQVLMPATMTFRGRSVRVSTVRDVGEMGLGASLGWALTTLGWVFRRSHQEETTQIEAAYGPELVGVRSTPEDDKRTVIDVVGMPSLAKVAKTYGSVILDHCDEGTHSYYVDGGSTIFRYRPGPGLPLEAQPEPRHRADSEGRAIRRLLRHVSPPRFGRVAALHRKFGP